jgi:hypothetical protein
VASGSASNSLRTISVLMRRRDAYCC